MGAGRIVAASPSYRSWLQMNQRLKSKVAIITGGASGMGETTAHVFCRQGATVVLADINEQEGQAVLSRIQKAGGEALFIRTDLTVEADVERLIDQTLNRYGRLDVLFSNAGVKNGLAKAHAISEEDWDWVLDTNLKGTFFCVKHAVPHMMAQHSGSIVVNASVAGVLALPNQPAYNASKAAEIQFAKSVAADYGQYNIRCNVICPGPIGGAFATKYIFTSPDEAERGKSGVGQMIPLGRMGTSDEVANVVAFLASEESSYVSGAMITIDGGMTLGVDIIGMATRFGAGSQVGTVP